MKFDRFDNDEPAPGGLEVVPDGDHVCEITTDKTWTAQDGSRSAVILTFQPQGKDIGFTGYYAFDAFLDPTQERDHKRGQAILAACGMEPTDELGEGELVGHRVIVTTKRATTKDGEPVLDKKSGLQRVWVNGVRAAPAAEKPSWQGKADHPLTTPPKSVAKRTALQKAKAAAAEAGVTQDDGDDVPF